MDKWNIGYEGDNIHIVIPRQHASDLLYALTLGLGGNSVPSTLQAVPGNGSSTTAASPAPAAATGKAGGKEGGKGGKAGGKGGGKSGGGKSGGKTAAKSGAKAGKTGLGKK